MSKVRNDILEQAKIIRDCMKISTRYLPEDIIFEFPKNYYEEWSADGFGYELNDVCLYNDKFYRCLQAHASQADWTPDAAVSLWVRIADPAEEWPEWIQPTGAHDAYIVGAKVSHNGKHWTSDVDGNVWEPGVYGWTEVTA